MITQTLHKHVTVNYSGYLEYDEHDRTYSRKKKRLPEMYVKMGSLAKKGL